MHPLDDWQERFIAAIDKLNCEIGPHFHLTETLDVMQACRVVELLCVHCGHAMLAYASQIDTTVSVEWWQPVKAGPEEEKILDYMARSRVEVVR